MIKNFTFIIMANFVIRIVYVHLLFIFIVLSLICQSLSLNDNVEYNVSPQIYHTNQDFWKSFKELSIFRLKRGRSKSFVSKYIRRLHEAIQEEEEPTSEVASMQQFPTIRSLRSMTSGLPGQEMHFVFKLSHEDRTVIKRMEIVLKETERLRSVSSSNLTLSLVGTSCANGQDTSVTNRAYEDFLIFDISCLLKSTLQDTVIVKDYLYADGKKIKISKRNEPLLVLFENSFHNPLQDVVPSRRRKRKVMHCGLIEGVGDNSCRRYNWTMNMNILHLDWYVAPEIFNAGYCDGQCTFPLQIKSTNSTSYAVMKSFWHRETFWHDEEVPRACCTPVDYSPLRILYINTHFEIVIATIKDMKVKSCGCR